ncbi:MAG: amylo-alpha-1,6-glucosidase [Microcoleaceae cyanobacterium]
MKNLMRVVIGGREICCDLQMAQSREWLITNGIGGYASGTLAGVVTRRYHGLLVAALEPPLGRTLLVTKFDETIVYNDGLFPIYTNYWQDGTVDPLGYQQIEQFELQGTTPTWYFAIADARLEKRMWMQPGENTTYIQYTLRRGIYPLKLSIKTLINHRDYHHTTQATDWPLQVDTQPHGVKLQGFPTATAVYILSEDEVKISQPQPRWYRGYDLAVERYRGQDHIEDHLHPLTLEATLEPGQSLTVVVSTEPQPQLNGKTAWTVRQDYEQQLIDTAPLTADTPQWLQQLVLAANQFIVSRPTTDIPDGKTIIAGYPWFGDWGRDTMISLPGLTLQTGQTEIARSILSTFAQYVDQGMLPNRFPDGSDQPDYNTVDATLWYFEAIRAYVDQTQDIEFLKSLFPILADIVAWHRRGTRYNVHLDPSDGLIYAGQQGTQLTWMDAKVGDWVVTPRTGKPIEVNALWYNALRLMIRFAQHLRKPTAEYETLAQKTVTGFQRYWNPTLGYCYDVLDTPDGDDGALRPNQLFAVAFPTLKPDRHSPLLTAPQQLTVVEICAQQLLTSYGLRSLSPNHPQYQGIYGGDVLQRDGAYHQGTVWGWLIGPFVQAHLHVYQNPTLAREFLQPFANHLWDGGMGNLSEIFDGDVPMKPRGCIAQAWTVAEVLRSWFLTSNFAPRSRNI